MSRSLAQNNLRYQDGARPAEGRDQAAAEEHINERDFNNSRSENIDDPAPIDIRQVITPQERTWALAIKEAVESDPDISNLQDFYYVQYALVVRGNIQEAVERIRHMEVYCQEYDIRNDLEQGKEVLCKWHEFMPGSVLSIFRDHEEHPAGAHVTVLDMAAMDDCKVQTESQRRLFFQQSYYAGHMSSSDFATIRAGVILLMECEGYDWHKFSLRLNQQIWEEFIAHYPSNLYSVRQFHNGLFINIVYSTIRKVLPRHVITKFQVGLQTPNKMRLDDIFCSPDKEESQKQTLERMFENLALHYKNVRLFKLV